jgi:hypothetical protein
MWPFSSKTSAPPPTADPDDWTLGEGERDGFPMILRLDNQFKRRAPLPEYKHHVILSVHLRDPSPNGFPSTEEGDDLDALEENLCKELEAGKESVCVLVVTNNGLRDFIFYTRNAESAHERIKTVIAGGTGFVIEIAIEPDSEWYIYKHFCDSLTTD